MCDNLLKIKENIPGNVKLVAVSKTKTNEHIINIYNKGQRIFGENKVQELVDKYNTLPDDIEWHMIGHLQTNKVKFIAPFVSLIHSLDSIKLAKEIDKRAKQNNRIIDCLLEVHIAKEESKFGIHKNNISGFIDELINNNFSNIRIVGLMGIASNSLDISVVTNEFVFLKNIFTDLKMNQFANNKDFKELSMGMSNDYMLAINAGATMVRIGSLIFGKRVY